MKPKILVVVGTRPEAIKMLPVLAALNAKETLETKLVLTAQHRSMLDQVLSINGIRPDIDLDLMEEAQSLDQLSARIITKFGAVLDQEQPDRVLVHGDTATTMMASIAAYYRKIPVGHVEAGLRSGDNHAPWPEEINRRITSVIADLHFAPTSRAREALRREGVDDGQIFLTGNTIVDALQAIRLKIRNEPHIAEEAKRLITKISGKKIITVTAHRRENFGAGMESIANAIVAIARRGDTGIIFPLHPNSKVRDPMQKMLGGHKNVSLIEPLDYPNFAHLLEASTLILTDSGGIQEEAAVLGRPVLVMRDKTERPEVLDGGNAKLVGTKPHRIVTEVTRLLDDSSTYRQMAHAHDVFGDGNAAERITDAIMMAHGIT